MIRLHNHIWCMFLLGCENQSTDSPQKVHTTSTFFESAETCKECHPNVYSEWKASAHSQAAFNPVYIKMMAKFHRDRGIEASSTTCTGCHMPAGVIEGEPAYIPLEKRSSISKEGITCTVCHKANEFPEQLIGEFDAIRLFFDKTETIFSTNTSASSTHSVEQSDFLGSSQMCLGCHDPQISHLESESYQNGIDCINCHMTTMPGLPDRGEISHTMLGLGWSQESTMDDFEFQQTTETYLKDYLTIEDIDLNQVNGINNLSFKLVNQAISHWIPAVGGVNNLKQLWIDISISNEDNEVVFRSGNLDSLNDLRDEYSLDVKQGIVDLDTQLWNFQTKDYTLVKEQMVPVTLSINSQGIHNDKSFKSDPNKFIEYNFQSSSPGPYWVEINVYRRHYSPYMLRELGLDEMALSIKPQKITSWSGIL